jgi:demethylmenaquinone methyltransferase/2-methoxy-6-polyprenyl-1,4-benzoquinol methylase
MEGLMASPPLTDKTPTKIAGMFDAIAGRYDLLNRVLSVGLDRYWRWRAVRSLRLTGGETVLDLCTGTADLAIALSRPRGRRRIIGIDFSSEMLRFGQQKVRRARSAAGVGGSGTTIGLSRGDAMRLPLPDRTVDAATVAFGIRNVQEPAVACRDMFRVLVPGGRLAVLEFAMPQLPILGWLYRWYFRVVLPRIGHIVSRHQDAYTYLPASVSAWASPGEFTEILQKSGFQQIRAVPLTFGVVYLYTAVKP